MTYENYIKARLVDLMVREAYVYGSVDAMGAVGQVIANRVNAGWGDWKAVIDSAPNYTGTMTAPVKVDSKDMTFRRVLAMVDDIYHGTADDSAVNFTDGRGPMVSLYYANLAELNRPWFQIHVLNDLATHSRLASVAQLTFFA